VVTHQLQVERRTAKARWPKTDVLPLDHATNQMSFVMLMRGSSYWPHLPSSNSLLWEVMLFAFLTPLSVASFCIVGGIIFSVKQIHLIMVPWLASSSKVLKKIIDGQTDKFIFKSYFRMGMKYDV